MFVFEHEFYSKTDSSSKESSIKLNRQPAIPLKDRLAVLPNIFFKEDAL